MSRKGNGFLLLLLVAAAVFAVIAVVTSDRRMGPGSGQSSDLRQLVDWNNEMIREHGRGHIERAELIARKILSRPAWRSFVPANAVMGSALAQKGDCAAAEPFFKAALSGRGSAGPQPAVMNDYADTLRRLGRYGEAETYARRAVALSGGRVRLFRQTLAEILHEAGKNSNASNSKEEET